jgi:hypothetical protein
MHWVTNVINKNFMKRYDILFKVYIASYFLLETIYIYIPKTDKTLNHDDIGGDC